MTRQLSLAAFTLGAVMVLWMASAFVGANLLALTVIAIIGAVYVIGFIELIRYQQASSTLSNALSSLPDTVIDLKTWLMQLHPSLQNGVRQRIEGEHVGLPAPVLTPYLVGLLVMLGLLGTFAGMVETLKGAVTALEGSSELEAIRAGLAAPIEGLGMAFGTSVAGVAASAMLGFISTLSRRERLLASRQLDTLVGTVFRDFSLSYNRQQTYQALQQQAQALPDVAEKLTILAEQLGQMSEHISTQLLSNQDNFHKTVKEAYSELASSVDQSLRASMAESGRLAGESIQPVVQDIMQGIQAEVQSTHQQLSATAQQQLETLSERFAQTTEGLLSGFDTASRDWMERQRAGDEQRLAHWSDAFEQSQQTLKNTAGELSAHTQSTTRQMLAEIGELLQTSETLVQARIDSETNWLSEHQQRMESLASTIQSELAALRQAEETRGEAAVTRLSDLQEAVSGHLATLGNALQEPMTRLIETASEAPRAAAEVIEKLRAEITKNIERDNSLLEDRRRVMDELNTLSGSLEQATNGQREAIEKMVASSADMLKSVGERFTEQVGSEVGKLSDIADHFAGGATELSSLGQAFGVAVQLFTDTNTELMEKLASVESSLQQSTERSDEQLAYYVAQAREIIDHNMLSQQAFIDQLGQLGELATAEVA